MSKCSDWFIIIKKNKPLRHISPTSSTVSSVCLQHVWTELCITRFYIVPNIYFSFPKLEEHFQEVDASQLTKQRRRLWLAMEVLILWYRYSITSWTWCKIHYPESYREKIIYWGKKTQCESNFYRTTNNHQWSNLHRMNCDLIAWRSCWQWIMKFIIRQRRATVEQLRSLNAHPSLVNSYQHFKMLNDNYGN